MMNSENIPNGLLHLIDLVEEWGINDDGYRDEQIERSTNQSLMCFVESITEEDIIQINNYLSDEEEMMRSSDEYINYTCFLMAYEYSNAVLKSRSSQHIL
jgi:hypothetical protein